MEMAAAATRVTRATPIQQAGIATAPPPAAAPPVDQVKAPSIEKMRHGWSGVVEALGTKTGPLPAALEAARPKTLKHDQLHLVLPSDQCFALTHLESRDGKNLVRRALAKAFGVKLDVSFSLEANSEKGSGITTQDIYENPVVQKLLEHFDGSISNVEKSNGQGV